MVTQDEIEHRAAAKQGSTNARRAARKFRGAIALIVAIGLALIPTLGLLLIVLDPPFRSGSTGEIGLAGANILAPAIYLPIFAILSYFLCGVLFIYSIVQLSTLPPSKSTASCVHCGYNLTRNTSGVCPECGKKIEREA